MPSSFRRVAVIGKLNSTGIADSLADLFSFLKDRRCEILVERETSVAMGLGGDGMDMDALGRNADLAVVVGGDGTMLAAARGLAAHGVPLIGVNQGRVGFMTDVALSAMRASIGEVLDGRYTIEDRALLQAELMREGRSLLSTVALNEVVVGKGTQGRLIEFELNIDGEFVYTLRADGVIVATPTGSTAYSLSAQGPILHPSVPALALVPLSPQTLSARPVSVSDRSVIELVLVRSVDARAHFDGFGLADMVEGDRLVLRRSPFAVHFVHPPGYDYFRMLREKLRWSQTMDRSGGDA